MRNVDSAYLQEIARGTLRPRWVFQVVDQDGNRHTIPGRAVLDRQRSGAVDGATWNLTLSVLTAMLPSGIRPQQYHRIEVSRIVAGTPYPYFVGIIDKEALARQLEAGAVIKQLQLEACGMLQRAKGYRMNSLRIDPVTQDGIHRLRGLGKWKTWTPGTGLTFGMSEEIPYGGPSTGQVQIYTDDTLTTAYVEGSDYDLTPGPPHLIQWTTDPSIDRVVRYDTVERFVILNNTYSGGSFLTLPEGRDYDDLFHTYVLDFTTTTIHTPFTMEVVDAIRVADPAGYDGTLNIAADDYVTITGQDGVDRQCMIGVAGLTDPDGWVPLVTTFGFHTNPSEVAVGDAVRLPTTEAIAAWDDDRVYQFWNGSGGSSDQEWNRTLLTPHPSLGLAIPTPHVWSTTDQVWIDSLFPGGVGYIREDVDANRIEEALKTILTTETGLFDPSEVITEPTGVYVKNRTWSGVDLSDVLAEAKDQAMSPSTFIHDTPDGKITIKPYRQKLEPDWELRGIQSIEETEVPEPITAVTVIAEAQEPVNLAGEWLYMVDDADNPQYLTDTIKGGSVATTASAGQDGFGVVFKIPTPEPSTIHPLIDSIRITGTGVVTAFFSPTLDAGPIYAIPGCNFAPIESGTLEITAEQIARVVTADAGFLFIWISRITSGNLESSTVVTAATCSEIEILTKKAGYWRAALTDDTNLAPANNGADAFGTIWRQPDSTKRQSYRYAPTSYLKRVQVLYPSAKAREKVLSMAAISQQDTRDYSERHQDEYLRAGKSYKIVALFDDRAELGDTVSVPMMDGTKRNLLLWGMSDGGGPGDVLCNYDFIDYGL
jgi:hypothetical protein